MEKTRASSTASDLDAIYIDIDIKPHQKSTILTEGEKHELRPRKYQREFFSYSVNVSQFPKKQYKPLRVHYDSATLTYRGRRSHFERDLKSLKQLQRFDIISDKYTSIMVNGGMKFLGEGLRHLHSLKTLDFFFEAKSNDNDVTNLDFYHFGKGLKSLNQLQSLNLEFNSGYSIGSEALRNLGEGIKYCSSLKSIRLYFNNCALVGIVGLAYLIKHLPAIINFSLTIPSCQLLDDQGLLNLSKGLKRLVSAQNIFLDFNRCNGITDYGIACLCEIGLKHLISIQSIVLDLSYLGEITKRGLKTLSDQLEQLKSLQNVSLNLDHCHKIGYYASEVIIYKWQRDSTLQRMIISGKDVISTVPANPIIARRKDIIMIIFILILLLVVLLGVIFGILWLTSSL